MTTPEAPTADQPITACLLHADYHLMAADCWGFTLDWMFNHEDIPEAQRRSAYQGAVERRILDGLRTAPAAGSDVEARTCGDAQ